MNILHKMYLVTRVRPWWKLSTTLPNYLNVVKDIAGRGLFI